jgi:hypothetical protein
MSNFRKYGNKIIIFMGAMDWFGETYGCDENSYYCSNKRPIIISRLERNVNFIFSNYAPLKNLNSIQNQVFKRDKKGHIFKQHL